MSCCMSCPLAHNVPTNAHMLLLPPTPPSFCRSLLCTSTTNMVWYTPTGAYPAPHYHRVEWDGDLETTVPRSQGNIGMMRRSCSSGSPMVLPGHCHRAASRMNSALWFCWKPSPFPLARYTETLGLPSPPGVKVRELCHSIGIEGEQPTENLQSKMVPSENCCRKGCAEDRSHLHQPLGAAHSTDHPREHSERLENDSTKDTFTLPDNDSPEFSPLCPPLLISDRQPPVPPALQCLSHLPLLLHGSSTALPNIYHFIYIFPTILLLLKGLKMLYLNYSWVTGKLQKAFVNRLDLPSWLFSNISI